MFLSELFIIYFAAAAPFAVSRFLAEQAKGTRARPALLRAAGAALSWPLTSLSSLLRRAASQPGVSTAAREGDAEKGRAVERSARAAVNALRTLEDLLGRAGGSGCEGARHALFAARECVERYTGLALACARADAGAAPAPREMELCRIAGRAGDDLLVAGRCLHRRSVTRLLAHRERARAELVRALAEVREAAHGIHAARQTSGSAEQVGGADVEQLRALLVAAFSRVVELLSLFGDEAASCGVARLLEEERGRGRDGAGRAAYAREGDESCTTRAVPTASATHHLPTTTLQRG